MHCGQTTSESGLHSCGALLISSCQREHIFLCFLCNFLTLSLPRVINFNFLFQSLNRDNISYRMENVAIGSLLRVDCMNIISHYIKSQFGRICIVSLGIERLKLLHNCKDYLIHLKNTVPSRLQHLLPGRFQSQME